MKALVTGGAGFIGSHLVEALLRRGDEVVTLDDLSTGLRENLAHLERHPAHRFILGDIRDPDACLAASRGVDVVFHEAALASVPRSMEDPAGTIAVNVAGTANVLQAARAAGVRRLVYASSSSVYGDSDRLPKREGEEGRPLSPYAATKQMAEALADVFGRCFGLRAIGLRYFNVYGPRQRPDGPYAAAIPRFLRLVEEGRPPTIYGDGRQTRDFTFVEDVVQANLLAASAPDEACGAVYNVATGSGASISELALRIIAAAGRALVPVHLPPRGGDVPHSVADVALARRRLGHEARWSLDAGLRRTIEARATAFLTTAR